VELSQLPTGEEVADIDETINPELSAPTRGAGSPIQVSEDSDIDGEEALETQSQTPIRETATTDQEHPSSSPSSATPVVSKKSSQSSLLLRKRSATNAVIAAAKKSKNKSSNTDKVVTVLNDIRADMKDIRDSFSKDHVQERAVAVQWKSSMICL